MKLFQRTLLTAAVLTITFLPSNLPCMGFDFSKLPKGNHEGRVMIGGNVRKSKIDVYHSGTDSSNSTSDSSTQTHKGGISVEGDVEDSDLKSRFGSEGKQTVNPIASSSSAGTQKLQIIPYTSITIETNDAGEIKLGEGGFGTVYKAKWKSLDVAVKKLHASLSEDAIDAFVEETEVWQNLLFPSITKLLGICRNPDCIVMDYKPHGSLHKFLQKNKSISWAAKQLLAKDIAAGLDYLHTLEKPVIHRDLKSLNVLISKENDQFKAFISDFGLSRAKRDISTKSGKTGGTLLWKAPELFTTGKCTFKTDIWALGMVFLELATGRKPYYDEDYDPAMIPGLIKDGTTPDIPSGTPADFTTIIKKCWSMKPNQRPTAAQIISLLEKSIIAKPASKSHPLILEINDLMDQAYPIGNSDFMEYRNTILEIINPLKLQPTLATDGEKKLKEIKNKLEKIINNHSDPTSY